MKRNLLNCLVVEYLVRFFEATAALSVSQSAIPNCSFPLTEIKMKALLQEF